jgi:hypothetical protein
MSKMFLETMNGQKMEIRDDTQWFHDKYNGNQAAILAYHDTVVKTACSNRNAGSLKNIKKLARYTDDGVCMEILVVDGMRL